MKKLKETIEDNQTKNGRYFDLFIQFLILISLVTFSIETLPNLSPSSIKSLNFIELICVIIFSIEYCLRIVVSDNKLKFIFSFYGIIDLIAIIPFYISLGIDLRSLRSFRLLRLFRAFKLIRYNRALQRFSIAFKLAKEELILFLGVTILLLFFSAAGIYYFENEAQPEVYSSIFDSLWWSTATLTTVGYGDIYPITLGGKLFTFMVLIIGLGIVSVPAGLISSALSKARDIEDQQKSNKT